MKIILTETQLNKLISEQEYIETNSRSVSFTEDDGVRRRAIPALGTLPDSKAY